jgi:hypothetical protein
MSPQPAYEILSAKLSCSQGEHELFLLIGGRLDLGAIEDEQRFHRGVADPFVTSTKG